MSLPVNDAASRRDFLKTSLSVGALTATLGSTSGLYAAGDETLKVGLIGCGGRGTGAASQALHADKGAKLVAMGDAFPEKISESLTALSGQAEIADQIKVDSGMMFSGLDAYKKVLEHVDVVLLATPPGFRPVHFKAAVEAGKHIFTEKPMATDVPGVRTVMAAVEVARMKKQAVVAGFCWRYDLARRALFTKLHHGAIGDIVSISGTYLTGPVKPMPPANTRPSGLTDLQWQVSNWYNFTWLGGDGLVEQAVHTVDWLAWVMKDVPPARCYAVGGRQIPAHGGNIYDHIEVNYVWENGTRGFLAQRQIPNCYNENNLYIHGTKGTAGIVGGKVFTQVGDDRWTYDGKSPDMYQVEHNELFESIRKGTPINDGTRMCTSTLMGIMGRMAGYTGKEITWEMALECEEVLVPEITSWDSPPPPIAYAVPGVTPYIGKKKV